MPHSPLRFSFFGDDFTGSTDALEALATAGVRTVLFTRPPTADDPAREPGLQAIGIAGTTRALDPAGLEAELRPALLALRALDIPFVHYKVCSTFDSSATVGSIGRAIEIGQDVFDAPPIPILAGTPSLGRYCAFGHLFARYTPTGEVHRIDRHPSMSRHPVTPMTESDLRLHLSRQTPVPIGLVDLTVIQAGADAIDARCQRLAAAGHRAILFDGTHTAHLAVIGQHLLARARSRTSTFIVGPSAVEEALVAAWNLPRLQASTAPTTAPILVLSGSCSPVTLAQIQRATAAGFAAVSLENPQASVRRAVQTLHEGRSIIIHTAADTRIIHPPAIAQLSTRLAEAASQILSAAPVRRLLIAGGDTSGQVARALGIERIEFIAPLVRGAPLCRAFGPRLEAGLEVCFKGGQIGPEDFFLHVHQGSSPA